MNPLNETIFEEHVAEDFAASLLYNPRNSSQFDIDRLVDIEITKKSDCRKIRAEYICRIQPLWVLRFCDADVSQHIS